MIISPKKSKQKVKVAVKKTRGGKKKKNSAQQTEKQSPAKVEKEETGRETDKMEPEVATVMLEGIQVNFSSFKMFNNYQ